jgi:putative ABC transport system substrate-binding protein
LARRAKRIVMAAARSVCFDGYRSGFSATIIVQQEQELSFGLQYFGRRSPSAGSLGLQLHVGRVSGDTDIDAAFESMVHAGARMLLVAADPFFVGRRDKLVALAAKHSLPSMWEWPEFVEGGGLVSYGTSIIDTFRQVGVYTGRVLKGENPADLPVIRPVKFELVINLKTAKRLGVEVPATLLARADRVVE